MHIHVVITVFVSVALSACAAVGKQKPESLYALGDRLARTVCAEASPEIQPVANLHVPGQTDQLETRRCSEGSSTLYKGKTTSNPAGLAVAVEVLAPRSGLPAHLEIGQPIKRAIELQGQPQEQAEGAVTYGLGIGGTGTVTIAHESDRITAVRWALFVD